MIGALQESETWTGEAVVRCGRCHNRTGRALARRVVAGGYVCRRCEEGVRR
jgi:cytochrome c553